jgi:hypothetical protein
LANWQEGVGVAGGAPTHAVAVSAVPGRRTRRARSAGSGGCGRTGPAWYGSRKPVAQALGSDEPELRASLVGSQIIGLPMTRYITELEPLATLPADRVADLIAPTLQHYLTDP